MVARRNGRARITDRRGRWLYPSGAAPGVDYLMTYSSNPISVDSAGVGSETVLNANIDSRIFALAPATVEWHIEIVPNWDETQSSTLAALKFNNPNRLQWFSGSFTYRSSGSGKSFPTVSWTAGDSLILVVQGDGVSVNLEVLINGVSAGTNATATTNYWNDVSAIDCVVGLEGSLGFDGDIYQPIQGLPAGSALTPL